MKPLLQWIRDHPLKAFLFAAFFAFMITFAVFRPDLLWVVILCSFVALAMLGIWMHLDETDRINRIVIDKAREHQRRNHENQNR